MNDVTGTPANNHQSIYENFLILALTASIYYVTIQNLDKPR